MKWRLGKYEQEIKRFNENEKRDDLELDFMTIFRFMMCATIFIGNITSELNFDHFIKLA